MVTNPNWASQVSSQIKELKDEESPSQTRGERLEKGPGQEKAPKVTEK